MSQALAMSTEEKRKKMEEIVASMQIKMNEIEQIRKEMYNDRNSKTNLEKASALLQEIIIPKIEIVKEEKKKK